jgi:signal transduction histidine kinase
VHIRFREDAEKASLVIEDNGRGFSSEHRDERKRDGHVGLSLIEGLATHLGGRASIQSVPGQGTRFSIEVPSR